MAWVVALRQGGMPDFPNRNLFAWLLSLFVPSVPGGFGTLLVTIAYIAIFAGVALPAYQDYVRNVELAAQMSSGGGGATNQLPVESADLSTSLTRG